MLSSSDSESDALVVNHALSASTKDSWIVDSGAMCHMCSNEKLLVELHNLKQPFEVTLGDGYALKATEQGIVALDIKLPQGKTRMRKLHNVLYVPNHSWSVCHGRQKRGRYTPPPSMRPAAKSKTEMGSSHQGQIVCIISIVNLTINKFMLLRKKMFGIGVLGIWEHEVFRSWLGMSWLKGWTMIHRKKFLSVSRVQKENTAEAPSQPAVASDPRNLLA